MVKTGSALVERFLGIVVVVLGQAEDGAARVDQQTSLKVLRVPRKQFLENTGDVAIAASTPVWGTPGVIAIGERLAGTFCHFSR